VEVPCQIGATEADTPDAAVTAAEVVITSLANDDAVREVALEEGAIPSAIGDRVYFDRSTISPGLSAELGVAFARFLALPILGAPPALPSDDASLSPVVLPRPSTTYIRC